MGFDFFWLEETSCLFFAINKADYVPDLIFKINILISG
jgi:hypothetical protein